MAMATRTGYQRLSSFMVREKYGLFREFQQLAYEDLLYRQSELVHLEKDIENIVKQDQETGEANEEKLHSFDWKMLSTSNLRGSPSKHWVKRLEVRCKLGSYCMSPSSTRVTYSSTARRNAASVQANLRAEMPERTRCQPPSRLDCKARSGWWLRFHWSRLWASLPHGV